MATGMMRVTGSETDRVARPAWRQMARWARRLALAAVLVLLLPALALAGPRSGGSFGGRIGFRSTPSMPSGGGYSRGFSDGYSHGYGSGGPSFFFLPHYGWGWGGYGIGGGLGTLIVLGVLGIAAYSLVRAARRRAAAGNGGLGWGQTEDAEADLPVGRAYVYKLQVGLGRTGRTIQGRLARFAEEGDTSSAVGLASLVSQTALELMRNKDAIRYAGAEGQGPMSMTNAETKLNGDAIAERSRFEVERVRGADGQVRRSAVAAEEGKEALELVIVTIVLATKLPMARWKAITDRAGLDAVLAELGGVSASTLLGLEVVWTPADENDSLTESDVMTTYPELRSL